MDVYGVSVKDFGARGDGSCDDAPAIQKALDAGKGLVVVPPGVYTIGGTLAIGSRTHLRVHPRARLRFGNGAGKDSSCFLLRNRGQGAGDEDITIEGGLWDGNNPTNRRGPDAPGSYTGCMIHLSNLRRFTLRDMTLTDPESYFVRIGEASNFLVERIRFRVRHVRGNQDGIHLAGFCEDAVIRHIDATGCLTPNDDVVALNADDACQRAQNLDLKCGPIRRVRIEHLRAEDAHTLVRLLSTLSPLEDITIEDVVGGCRVSALNLDAARGCMVPVFDPADPRCDEGIGRIARVQARGFNVHKTHADVSKPLIDIQGGLTDVEVCDFARNVAMDANPGAPTVRVAHVDGAGFTFDGLDESQMQALRASNPAAHAKATRLRTLDDSVAYRMSTGVRDGETLLLPAGGFGRMLAMNGVGKR